MKRSILFLLVSLSLVLTASASAIIWRLDASGPDYATKLLLFLGLAGLAAGTRFIKS